MDHEHASSWRQLVVSVGEGIKLSLSNLKLREMMGEQATHDSLTGLFNRRYLDDTLPREINHARRQNSQMCIAMLDIDHFKQFND
jgi:GGDEF domain-containing protein